MASVYPVSLDTDDTLYIAVNGRQFTLSADINSNVVVVPVNESTTGMPATGFLTIAGEAIHYGSLTTNSFTGCTRHTDGTQAASHLNKAVVKAGLVAIHHNALKDSIIALETKVGTGTAGIDGVKLKDASVPASKLQSISSVGFKVRVYRLAALLFPANTPTSIAFDTLSGLDPGLMYDSVNKRIVCKKDGVYTFTGSVTILADGGPLTQVLSALYKNGTEFARGSQIYSPSSTPTLPVSDQIPLVVNDYVTLVVDAVGNNAHIWTTGNTGQFNYLSASLQP